MAGINTWQTGSVNSSAALRSIGIRVMPWIPEQSWSMSAIMRSHVFAATWPIVGSACGDVLLWYVRDYLRKGLPVE